MDAAEECLSAFHSDLGPGMRHVIPFPGTTHHPPAAQMKNPPCPTLSPVKYVFRNELLPVSLDHLSSFCCSTTSVSDSGIRSSGSRTWRGAWSVDHVAPWARLRVARERPSVEGEQLIVTEFASGQPVDDENGR